MDNYLCERCGYKTERISNFKNHLNRKFICKPKLKLIDISEIKKKYNIEITKEDYIIPTNIPMNIPKIYPEIYPENEYKWVCEFCSKTLSSYKNKWRHKKTCKHKNNDLEEKNILIEKNKELTQKVNELIEKVSILENRSIINTNINSFNNIQVNNYGSENIDYISEKVFKNLLNTPLSAIPKLIELKYFNPEHPENHNVKITNIHDKFAKIYKDNKWLISHKKDVIAELVDNGYADFEEFKDLNEEQVTEKIKEKYSKMEKFYLNNTDELCKKSEVIIINGTNKLNDYKI